MGLLSPRAFDPARPSSGGRTSADRPPQPASKRTRPHTVDLTRNFSNKRAASGSYWLHRDDVVKNKRAPRKTGQHADAAGTATPADAPSNLRKRPETSAPHSATSGAAKCIQANAPEQAPPIYASVTSCVAEVESFAASGARGAQCIGSCSRHSSP